MAATYDIKVPVDEHERDELRERAGPAGVAAMIRAMLGLPPRERGRPKVAKPKPSVPPPAPKPRRPR